MAQIDIIDAAKNAYRMLWDERSYLMRLVMVPLAIKFICFGAVAALGEGGSYLRTILIMLPALLAEGWMLSHLARLPALGHRWPFRPSGNMDADLDALGRRSRGIMSGMIVYVLINMAMGLLFTAASGYFTPFLKEGAEAAIPPQAALLSIVMLSFLLWGFRLAWVFIAYALGMTDLPRYLHVLRGVMTSIHFIGVWLLCFLPVYVLLAVFGGVIAPLLNAALGNGTAMVAAALIGVVADTLKAVLTTTGITFALLQVFRTEKVELR